MTEVKCLTCASGAVCRGLCKPCYDSAMNAIDSGKYTEAEAIKNKLILPVRQSPWLKQAEKAIK